MTSNNTCSSKGDKKKTTKPRQKCEVKLLESGAKNKQRCDFARHWATHGDKARARREANYKQSPNEYVLACKLANEPDVIAAHEYWKEKNRAKLDLRTEAVLGEIHSIGFSNIADVWEWDENKGVLTLKDITKLPRRITAAIKKVSTAQRTYYDVNLEQEVTETIYNVEMHNKWNALKHLADLIPKLKPHTSQGVAGGTEAKRKVVEVQIKGGTLIGKSEDDKS